jgi:hypothetical protein
LLWKLFCDGGLDGEFLIREIREIRGSIPLLAALPGGDLCPEIRQNHAFATTLPAGRFTGKIQSQGNDCQGNGKKRSQVYSPDNHSPDCSPAFSILYSPSSILALVAASPCCAF